ncbi:MULTISPECIES: DUF29 domain-containing protein [unclassified Caballeronia]|jgi:hypothetical protein|uniref:DUF29 domain-containing protein n=1 Tax=unclassified Caballeronia TaxID=2646786 RepID=UPI002029910F|nr:MULTISPECIES: DUF29 domain-containing protein [unclassified Caballeronia]MDR5796649.1 DUF29 domain-containing protein [Caballeronia sp. LZ008]
MNKGMQTNIGDTGNDEENGSQPMGTPYEKDVVAWAWEQAALLRAGKFASIDIEHIAEEIEDVAKTESRELRSRLAVLLAHLLKWQFQPERRSRSWTSTIRTQRREALFVLNEAPSLRRRFDDVQWLDLVWSKARTQAEAETGIDFDTFPASCPWPMSSVLEEGFLPE